MGASSRSLSLSALIDSDAAPVDQLIRLSGRQRMRKQIALCIARPHASKLYRLFKGFYSLGYQYRSEFFRELNQPVDDRPVGRVVQQIIDEGPIDLELADRQVLQMGKRGKTRSKIIQRNAISTIAPLLKKLGHMFAAASEHTSLRDLEG